MLNVLDPKHLTTDKELWGQGVTRRVKVACSEAVERLEDIVQP
mgnify:CR=1 FL=1